MPYIPHLKERVLRHDWIKHLLQLKKATLKSGDPIFKSIFYRQGRIHFTFSKAVERARAKSRQYAVVSISEFCKIRSKNVKALYLRMLFATQKFTLRITPPELTNFFGYRKPKNIKKGIIKPFVRLIQAHTTLRITNYSFKKGLLTIAFKLAYDGFCYIDKIKRHAFRILTQRYNQEAYIANQAIAHLSIQALDKLDRRLIKKKAQRQLDDLKSYAFVSIQNELNKTLLKS